MSNYAAYFWQLLPGYLRGRSMEESDTGTLVKALGPQFDELQEAVFAVRDVAVLQYATGQALDAHGADRRMPRYAGESDDDYRRRLLEARTFYAAAGTEAGMRQVLAAVGFPFAQVYPLWREKNNWWPMDGTMPLDGTWSFSQIEPPGFPEYFELDGGWAQFVVWLGAVGPIEPLQERIVRDAIAHMQPAEGMLYQLHVYSWQLEQNCALTGVAPMEG